MSYARWATKEELLEKTVKVNKESKTLVSGVPLLYDEDNLYLHTGDGHSLIVGSTGSGKTQTTILPLLKTTMLAGESIVVNDSKGELYERTANNFRDNGYDVLVIDFDNPKYGDSWNPLQLPYQLYLDNEKDKALKIIEDVGYYLFSDFNELLDPFWVNSTIDYFTGLVLYLFENAESTEINLKSVFALGNELKTDEDAKEFLNKISKDSSMYYSLSGTLEAPYETRGGIISTFNQKSKVYISRDNLSNMMLKSSFDMKNLTTNKTIIYIISGISMYSNALIPLFVNQVVEIFDIYRNNNKLFNVVLDEFDNLYPIRNFAEIINYSRGLGIRFTVVIKSFSELDKIYGKENAMILRMCFGKIIYLLSNDGETLEEISRLCGNQEKDGKICPIITIDELRQLKLFEAIVLIPRMMPIRTMLIPDYEIKWNFDTKMAKLTLREENKLEIFNY